MAKYYRYISHLAVLIAKLNAQRTNKGLPPITVAELSRDTGISRQSIYRWLETDKPLITVNEYTVDTLKDYFKVSDEELYTRIDLRDENQLAPAHQLI